MTGKDLSVVRVHNQLHVAARTSEDLVTYSTSEVTCSY